MNNSCTYVKLKDICDFINGDRGKNYPSIKDFVQKGIPFINAGHIVENRLNFENMNYINEEKYEILGSGKIKKNDIVYCLRGSLGKNAIVEIDKGAIASSLVILRPKKNLVNTDYLFRYLNSKEIQEQINRANNGSSQPNLSATSVKEFKIFLPDYDLQNKISKTLIKAQELIDKRKKQLEALDELVKSRFIEMFGDPINNPMGWEKAVCKNITSKIGSGATPKGGNSSYKEDGISLIRSMNVHNNRFIKKDLAFIDDVQAQKLNNVIVEMEDVLLNITGASVARSCIVPNELIPARVNQHVAIIRSKKESVLPIFVVYQFTNESYQRLLWDIATSGGATREAITKQQIENLELIVPPIELQNQFSTFVKQVDKLKFEAQKSLTEMENNFNSLMQRAFK